MQPLETALRFLALGVATIPVIWRQKEPHLNSWRPYQTQLPTPEIIAHWFGEPSNIGVVTGWRGLTVLDFDQQPVYDEWLQWCGKQDKYSVAATVAWNAYRVSTSRGVHVYVWTTTPERNRKLPGIDVKARNGYVLGEGSIHPSGAPYKALQPGMIIPTVQTLSDILPPNLLIQSDHAPHVVTPTIPSASITDPWQMLDQGIAITGQLVERIKRHWSLTDFLSHTERTSADGRWLRCPCPLHDDADPSFWIDTRDQVCGCFAGCTAKPLDVINLYARLCGLNNREAIFQLARLLP